MDVTAVRQDDILSAAPSCLSGEQSVKHDREAQLPAGKTGTRGSSDPGGGDRARELSVGRRLGWAQIGTVRI